MKSFDEFINEERDWRRLRKIKGTTDPGQSSDNPFWKILWDDVKYLIKPIRKFFYLTKQEQESREQSALTLQKKNKKPETIYSHTKWAKTIPGEEVIYYVTINDVKVKFADSRKGMYAATEESKGWVTKFSKNLKDVEEEMAFDLGAY